jgi:hypothetical protein
MPEGREIIMNRGLPDEIDPFEGMESFNRWRKHPTNVLAERDDSVVKALCYDAKCYDEDCDDKHYVKKRGR